MIASSLGRRRRALARLSVGVACGLALLVAALALPSVQRTSLAAEFSPGERVEVVDGPLNIRAAPGLDAAVLRVLDEGMAFTLTDGPVAADGYTWYKVNVEGASFGWVAGEFLALADGGGDFAVGDQVRIATDALNVREAPGLDAAVIDVVTFWQRLTVADGPVNADGYTWYQVYPDAPGIGWVAGEYLVAA